MTPIEQIQAIDLDKITNEGLKEEVSSYLQEYNEAKDKEYFLKANAENTQTVLEMIEGLYPELLIDPKHPCFDLIQQGGTLPKEKIVKQHPPTPKKVTPKAIAAPKAKDQKKTAKKLSNTELKAQIQDLKTELAACRKEAKTTTKSVVKKRTPKVSKEVYDKTVKHLHSIINLIPDHIQKDQEKIVVVRQMILSLHRKLVKTYGIDANATKEGKLGLTQKFEKIITPLNSN